MAVEVQPVRTQEAHQCSDKISVSFRFGAPWAEILTLEDWVDNIWVGLVETVIVKEE